MADPASAPGGPAPVAGSPPMGCFAFVSRLLFWPALLLACLPGLIYLLARVLEAMDASYSTVRDWDMAAGIFVIFLTPIAGAIALILGLIVLNTPRSRVSPD